MSIVPRRRAPARPIVAVPPELAPERPGIGQRVLRRVVEGAHEWGDLEVWPSRYGYTSYCLVVYPPGATLSERVRFRLMRSWPPLGMLLGITVVIAAAHVLPLLVAGVIGASVYAGGGMGLAVLAGPGRRRIRTLRTCRGGEGAGSLDRGPQSTLDELAAVLLDAEHARREGLLDAAALEVVQGEVWQRLGSRGLQR